MTAVKTVKSEHKGEEFLANYYATKNPAMREMAIREFLPLVYYVVNRVTLPVTDAITKEDLEQSAIQGLLEAIDRFDRDRNVRFKTFAYKRIYGAVIDAIRQVRILSRTKLERLMTVQRITERLTQELKREPTAQEVCDEADITLSEHANLLAAGHTGVAL